MYPKIPGALPLKVRPGDSWSGRFLDKFSRSGVSPSFDRRTARNSSNSQALFFGWQSRGFTKSSARPLSCREVSALIPTFFSAMEMCCQVRIISEPGDSGGHSKLRFEGKKTGNLGQSSNDSGARCGGFSRIRDQG